MQLLKTRAVAHFFSDARTFHNIYKLQKQVILSHQSFLIVFMGNTNLQMAAILLIIDIVYGVCRIVIKSIQQCTYFLFSVLNCF
jgi:hypothetical protein